MEIWKDVEGYEGYYQVSNHGRVKSLERYVPHPICGMKKVSEKILSQSVESNGYFRTSLTKNGKCVKVLVHILVAKAFIPIPISEKKLVVRHGIEGQKVNTVKNLCWGTHSENEYDKQRDGTNPNLNKECCPLGHKYEGDNLGLRGSGRRCKSCDRASAYTKSYPEKDFKETADLYYKEILTGQVLIYREPRPESKRIHCPRGHRLVEPNLDPSQLKRNKRSCRSCVKAREYLRRHEDDLQTVSDRYYTSFMGEL